MLASIPAVDPVVLLLTVAARLAVWLAASRRVARFLPAAAAG